MSAKKTMTTAETVRALAVALFLLVGLGGIAAVSAPAPAALFGPAPRDADGRFRNTDVTEMSHGSFGTRFPFFLRRIGGAFGSRPGAPERVENDGAALRGGAGPGSARITWVGHATMLVQLGGVNFLTDPIWAETASPVSFAGPRRFVEPGLALDALPPIDFVVVSHNHYDHLELGTLRAIAERHPTARFFVPLENGELLRKNGIANVEELDWGETREVRDVTVHCLPSQHWSRRGLRDERRSLWAAWAVTHADRRVYFGGDTGYFPGFQRIGEVLGPFDLAIVPIGAYQPTDMMKLSHLDPEEAVQAALDLRARRMLGMHFGTFDLSDEPLDEPPRRFRAAAQRLGVPAEDAWIFDVGETRTF